MAQERWLLATAAAAPAPAKATAVVRWHYIIFICQMIVGGWVYMLECNARRNHTLLRKPISFAIFRCVRVGARTRAHTHPERETTFIQSDCYYFLRTIFRVLIFHLSALVYENSVIVILAAILSNPFLFGVGIQFLGAILPLVLRLWCYLCRSFALHVSGQHLLSEWIEKNQIVDCFRSCTHRTPYSYGLLFYLPLSSSRSPFTIRNYAK